MTADQISTQIVDAITKYSPAAYETAKAVERINAIDWLLTDLGMVAIGLFIAWMGRFCWKHSRGSQYDSDVEGFQKFGSGVVVATGALWAAFATVNMLASPWLIVGLTDPGLALAHEAMKKVLGS
jgi:hypothetical protein